MLYQIFLPLQVKGLAIITPKHGIYELPNYVRLSILQNYKLSGQSLNLLE